MVTVTESRPTAGVSADDAAVSGRLVTVLPEAVNRTCGSFDRPTRRLLCECGIDGLVADRWYSRSAVLAMCDNLESAAGSGIVERIGRFVPELVGWPAHVETIEDGFAAIEKWYDDLHRGHDDTVRFESTGRTAGTVTLDTPYPPAFEAGLVRGLCLKIQTDSMQVYVHPEENASGETIRYEVSWYRIGTVMRQ
jgi:hypothetical protein